MRQPGRVAGRGRSTHRGPSAASVAPQPRVRAAGSPPPRRPARGGRGRRGRAPAGRRRSAPACRQRSRVAATSGTVPAAPFSRSSSGSRPMAAARRAELGLVAPHSTGPARRSTRARPDRGRWPRTQRAPGRTARSNVRERRNGQVELGRRSGRRGRACDVGPSPPMMIGGAGCCSGLGRRRRVRDRGSGWPVNANRSPIGVGPQPGDDRELLLEPVEALSERRERDAVGRVLGLVPAGAEPELDPAAAHLVDLGHGDRERAGVPERRRRDERAEADRGRLAGQAGQRDPGVGRAGQAVGRRPSRGSGRSGRSASKPRCSVACATASRSS